MMKDETVLSSNEPTVEKSSPSVFQKPVPPPNESNNLLAIVSKDLTILNYLDLTTWREFIGTDSSWKWLYEENQISLQAGQLWQLLLNQAKEETLPTTKTFLTTYFQKVFEEKFTQNSLPEVRAETPEEKRLLRGHFWDFSFKELSNHLEELLTQAKSLSQLIDKQASQENKSAIDYFTLVTFLLKARHLENVLTTCALWIKLKSHNNRIISILTNPVWCHQLTIQGLRVLNFKYPIFEELRNEHDRLKSPSLTLTKEETQSYQQTNT